MKKIIFFIFLFSLPALAQFQHAWTSSAYTAGLNSGWIYFDQNSDGWRMRLYTLDSLKFQIMDEGLSSNVAYSYYFNPGEISAGSVISSLKYDLNGDGKTDFYTLSQSGYSNPRQSFKIFDITNNVTIFEKNDVSWYYYDPILLDFDNDGYMECLVIKLDYPWMTSYYYEVYRTNVLTTSGSEVPSKFELLQNYPNPFNPTTKISFQINKTDNVSIRIYDLKGELITTLLDEIKHPGFHETDWNGTNSSGTKQSSGIYFYELTTGAERSVKKMLMLK